MGARRDRRKQEEALADIIARSVERGREMEREESIREGAESLLRQDAREAAEAAQNGTSSLSGLVAGWVARWVAAFGPLIRRIMQAATINTDRGPVSAGFDVTNPENEAYFRDYVLRLAEGVTETTREKLEGAIREGVEEGLPIPEIARRVSEVGEEFAGYRSELIARTETLNASRGAAHIQAQRSGVVKGKRWMATRDSRTRPEHRELDGAEVGLEEPFPNGEVYPSSPNCRCSVQYTVDYDAIRGGAA